MGDRESELLEACRKAWACLNRPRPDVKAAKWILREAQLKKPDPDSMTVRIPPFDFLESSSQDTEVEELLRELEAAD